MHVLPVPPVLPQGAVVKRYKEMVRTATICSFNPMVDDFINARFFFGDALGRGASKSEVAPLSKAAERMRVKSSYAPPPSTGIPQGLPEWAEKKLQEKQQQQQQGRVAATPEQQQQASSEPVLGGQRLQRKE